MNYDNDYLYKALYTAKEPLIKVRGFEDVNVVRNMSIVLGLLSVTIYQFYIAPLLIQESLWYALSLLPTLLLSSTVGVVVHESIHGLMHPNKRVNRLIGQAMSIFMGISYDLQKFDHLRHHRASRSQDDCDEVYIANRASKKTVTKYYYRKLLGAYWNDFFLSTVICFFPKRHIFKIMSCIYGSKIDPADKSALSILIRTGHLLAMRIEGTCIVGLIATSVYLYNDNLWIFAIMYFSRAFILTVLDSFAHYQTPINDNLFARNIKLPIFFEKVCMMNFNYHGVHHIFPTVPWDKVPSYMNRFDPAFCLISHGGIYTALKAKYTKPRNFEIWPKSWLPGGSQSEDVLGKKS